jgi:Protein of unknown function (DUF3224)
MTSTVESTLVIESWDERPVDDAIPKVTRATVAARVAGAIDGTSLTEYVMAYRDDGSAVYVGLERITGVVAGREGTLVLRHLGTYEGGAARSAVEVVGSSGSDGLAGVSGAGDFLADPAPSLRLDLTFG